MHCFRCSGTIQGIYGGAISTSAVRSAFSKLKDKRDKLYRNRNNSQNLSQNWQAFLDSEWKPPTPSLQPVACKTATSTNEEIACGRFEKFDREIQDLVNEKLKSDLKTAELKVEEYKEIIQQLEVDNACLKKKLDTRNTKKINQTIKRKGNQVSLWKKKYYDMFTKAKKLEKLNVSAAKSRRKPKDHVQELKNLKHSISNAKYRNKQRKIVSQSNTQDKIYNNLVTKVKELTEEIEVLQNENLKMKEIMNDECRCSAEKIIKTKSGNLFTEQLRMCIFKCLSSQVPVEKIGEVLKFVVSELTPHDLDCVPSISSICRIAREMGIISDLQTASSMISNNNNTFAWDSTPIDGKHINEAHINTKEGSFTIGLSSLPGGKAVDYHQSIMHSLDDLSTSYSEFAKADKSEVKKTFFDNITSTMGDRVPVNHVVVEKLSESFDHPLIELNCNLHPLDGLANASRKVLKGLEVKSATFGKEAGAMNFIAALCKMRYKASTGDPSGFKQHMIQNNIAFSLVPRYVGNRLHILFQLAGVFYCFRDCFNEYLCKYCPVSNGLRGALIKDIQNLEIVCQLQVLGLYGKLLTGPWMTNFYVEELSVNHFSIIEPLKVVLKELQAIKEDGGALFRLEKDLFGKPLDPGKDKILSGKISSL